MTTAPSFRFSAQLSTSGLYYGQADDGSRQRVDQRVIYFPRSVATAPAATLSLAESWSIPSIYLFLGDQLLDEPGFVRKLNWLLASATLSSARLLWILNPNDQLDRWT